MFVRAATFVALGIAAASLAGCGGVRHLDAPFVKDDSTEAGGRPILGSGPSGLTLRFMPLSTFGVGIVVRNRAREQVAIVDVRAVEPPRSLVHQLGTRLLPWNPPRCNGHHSCPLAAFLHGPYSRTTPRLLRVGAGRAAGIQLNFALGGCAEVPFASPATVRQVEVDYRYGKGAVRQQLIWLGPARLLLRLPTAKDCAS
jgi:hypothetical protein